MYCISFLCLLVTAFPDIDERLAKLDENPLFRGCSRLFRQPCMGVKVLKKHFQSNIVFHYRSRGTRASQTTATIYIYSRYEYDRNRVRTILASYRRRVSFLRLFFSLWVLVYYMNKFLARINRHKAFLHHINTSIDPIPTFPDPFSK